MAGRQSQTGDLVPLRTATRAWFGISLQTFGGPAGQIAVMQRTLVDERRWIGRAPVPARAELLHAAAGPGGAAARGLRRLAPQRRGRRARGRASCSCSPAWSRCSGCRWSTRSGARPLWSRRSSPGSPRPCSRSWRRPSSGSVARVLHRPILVGLAVGGLRVPRGVRPAVPVGGARCSPGRRARSGGSGRRWRAGTRSRPTTTAPRRWWPTARCTTPGPTWRRAAVVLGIGLPVWLAPVGVAFALTGPDSVYTEQGLFFSGTALVTFGGAYAVLAYVAQRAVEVYGWLAPGEMAARPRRWRRPPRAADHGGPVRGVPRRVPRPGHARPAGWPGIVASLLTTWVTFVPSLPVHLPRGALRRAAARQRPAWRLP